MRIRFDFVHQSVVVLLICLKMGANAPRGNGDAVKGRALSMALMVHAMTSDYRL